MVDIHQVFLVRVLSLDDSFRTKLVLLFRANHPVPKSWIVSCGYWLEYLAHHPPSKTDWKKFVFVQLHSLFRDDFMQRAASAQSLSELNRFPVLPVLSSFSRTPMGIID